MIKKYKEYLQKRKHHSFFKLLFFFLAFQNIIADESLESVENISALSIDNAYSFVKRRDIAGIYKIKNPSVDLEDFPLINNHPLYPFFYDNYITTFDAKELLGLYSANENEREKAFKNLLFSSHKYSLTFPFIKHLLLPPQIKSQNLSELKNIPANFSMKDFKEKCESYLSYLQKGLITKFQEWKNAQESLYGKLPTYSRFSSQLYRSYLHEKIINLYASQDFNIQKEIVGQSGSFENENWENEIKNLHLWGAMEVTKRAFCHSFVDKTLNVSLLMFNSDDNHLKNLLETSSRAVQNNQEVVLKPENYKEIIEKTALEIKPNVEGTLFYFPLTDKESGLNEKRNFPLYLTFFPSLHQFFFPHRHFALLKKAEQEKLTCLIPMPLTETQFESASEEPNVCFLHPQEVKSPSPLSTLKFFLLKVREKLPTEEELNNLDLKKDEDKYMFISSYKWALSEISYSSQNISDLICTFELINKKHIFQYKMAKKYVTKYKDLQSGWPLFLLFFERNEDKKRHTLLYYVWKMEQEKHKQLSMMVFNSNLFSQAKQFLIRAKKFEKTLELFVKKDVGMETFTSQNSLLHMGDNPTSKLLTGGEKKQLNNQNFTKLESISQVKHLIEETAFLSDWAGSQLESMEILAHKTWDKKCAKAGIPQIHLTKDPLFKAVKEFLELSRDSNKKVCLFAEWVLKKLEKNAPARSQET